MSEKKYAYLPWPIDVMQTKDHECPGIAFFPVIKLPEGIVVKTLDLSNGMAEAELKKFPFAFGRYNEDRKGVYTAALFEGVRTIHMGVDLFAPVGNLVFAFADGVILYSEYRDAVGDYGATIVTKHIVKQPDSEGKGVPLYALYGHLSRQSLTKVHVGSSFRGGDVLGSIGDRTENGGWYPHLHLQLSWEEPRVCDMPGVVSVENREAALKMYPDPSMILGKLWEEKLS